MSNVTSCKGCATNDGCPFAEYLTEKVKCTCEKCLVKVMCDAACDDHIDFILKMHHLVYHELVNQSIKNLEKIDKWNSIKDNIYKWRKRKWNIKK